MLVRCCQTQTLSDRRIRYLCRTLQGVFHTELCTSRWSHHRLHQCCLPNHGPLSLDTAGTYPPSLKCPLRDSNHLNFQMISHNFSTPSLHQLTSATHTH